MKARWGMALLPIMAGLVIASLFTDVQLLENPTLTVHTQVGTLSLWVGGIGTLLYTGSMVLWNLSERKCNARLHSENIQNAEERYRFLQRLDHELKNPLTAIRAGLANIVIDAVTPEQEKALGSVESQVLRLNRLTADLRKLAELETQPLTREPVAIAALLEEALLLAQEQPGAETRRLTLTLSQVPWPVPDILGDWDLLFLAIYNLLDNAIKFTQPGDTLVIRAFEDGTSVVIEVADTGPGIPEDELLRVWEELYRGQDARGIPGSGLGLALVRAIIERHKGHVSLRSRLGQGTIATIRLPID